MVIGPLLQARWSAFQGGVYSVLLALWMGQKHILALALPGGLCVQLIFAS